MRKSLFALLLVFALLLAPSCVDDTGERDQRTLYIVSMALNYEGTEISELAGTLNDQKAMVSELCYLAMESGMSVRSISFTEDGPNTYKTLSILHPGTEESTNVDTMATSSFKMPLKEALIEIGESAQENDLFIFYYAGHGIKAPSSRPHYNGALVMGGISIPLKGSYLDVAENLQKIMTLQELKNAVEAIGSDKVLILDSCFSGSAISIDNAVPSSGEYGKAIRRLFDKSDVTEDKLWVISASQDDQSSYEESAAEGTIVHGSFTHSLLKNLGYRFYNGVAEGPGKTRRTRITLGGLYEAVKEDMEDDEKQTPCTDTLLKDLVLFRHL